MPVDPAATSMPCPPPHHGVHHIVGRFRHRGIVHHLAGNHGAAAGCAKLPPGAPGALLPKLIPAAIALAAGAALLAAAAALAAPTHAPADPSTILIYPSTPLPAWPPNDPRWFSPAIPHRQVVPVSEPSSTPLLAAAAALLIALSGRARRRTARS